MKKPIKLETFEVDRLEGPIDRIIDFWKNKKESYEKKGFTDITVEFNTKYGYYDEQWIEATCYGKRVGKVGKQVG